MAGSNKWSFNFRCDVYDFVEGEGRCLVLNACHFTSVCVFLDTDTSVFKTQSFGISKFNVSLQRKV